MEREIPPNPARGKTTFPWRGAAYDPAHEIRFNPASPSYTRHYRRLGIPIILAGIGLVFCTASLYSLQIHQGPSLAAAAQNMRVHDYPDDIVARRGDITDRKGVVLATSDEAYDLNVNQKQVQKYVHKEIVLDGKVVTGTPAAKTQGAKKTVVGKGAVEAARQLAPILGEDPAVLGGKLVGERGFRYIAKNITPQQWKEIRALRIDGIGANKKYVRRYPAGALASSLLGFVNSEGQGMGGLEATQNQVLTGTPGVKTLETSPSGQIIPGGINVVKEPIPGKTVRLSLDADLQAIAEKTINEQVAKSQSEWGSAIVQDLATGHILALADSGNQPPDKQRTAGPGGKPLGSRSVQFPYPPGSTGKVITFADALAQGKITPLTPLVCSYWTEINGQKIHDYAPHPTLKMTATGVLARSYNSGTLQVAQRVTDKSRYDLMHQLTWGTLTGIEIPGESEGIIRPWEKWDGRTRLVTSFGQGMAITPIQLSAMTSIVGNQGIYAPPRLVEGYVGEHGEYTPLALPTPDKRLDPQVARTLVRMMESVVTQEGTTPTAQIDGYRVAGKSGTAEIINAAGALTGVATSFSGVAPADNPKLAVSVLLYKPAADAHSVGRLFSKIMGSALEIFNVPPSNQPAQLYPIFAQ